MDSCDKAQPVHGAINCAPYPQQDEERGSRSTTKMVRAQYFCNATAGVASCGFGLSISQLVGAGLRAGTAFTEKVSPTNLKLDCKMSLFVMLHVGLARRTPVVIRLLVSLRCLLYFFRWELFNLSIMASLAVLGFSSA